MIRNFQMLYTALILAAVSCLFRATAFSPTIGSSRSVYHPTSLLPASRDRSGSFALASSRGGGGGGTSDPALALMNVLSDYERQWKIQQLSSPKPRWTKLVIYQQPHGEGYDSVVMEEAPAGGSGSQQDYVYLLEPPDNREPSCQIVFIGGAGLGQFPEVAYNELLLRLSDRLNAAILTAPYGVGLDHFALAGRVGELTRRAMIHCKDDPGRRYPSSLPTYCFAHSLGCKLATIYMAATGRQFDRVAFMCFNNFSFSQTMGMATDFANEIGGKTTSPAAARQGGSGGGLGQLFAFAESMVGAIGLDFAPNPAETKELIALKYDVGRQKKTRLIKYNKDNLDSTKDFVDACQAAGGQGPDVSLLPGTHLSPVYFKLDTAGARGRGVEGKSFGSEQELQGLVDDICNWIQLNEKTS